MALNNKNTTYPRYRKALRYLLRFALAVVVLLVLVSAVLQIPAVQTFVVNKVSKEISERSGYPISIDYLSIKWFDVAALENVMLRDTNGDTLIYVPYADVDLDLLTLVNQFDERVFHFDKVRLEQPRVALEFTPGASFLNIVEFSRSLKKAGPSDSLMNTLPPQLLIDEIAITNGRFNYNDRRKDSLSGQFDYFHFNLVDVNLNATEFNLIRDSVSMNITDLSVLEPENQLTINEARARFNYNRREMGFRNLYLATDKTELKDSVVFSYRNPAALGNFNEEVTIHANINESRIFSGDLGLFAPYFQDITATYQVGGMFRGRVNRFTVNNFQLDFGRNSRLMGKLNIDGLPNVNESFIQIDLESSKITASDLKPYLNRENYRQALKFGMVRLNAEFLGFPNDFVANGSFRTRLGNITSDINLKLNQEQSYSGSLKLDHFNLGIFSGDTTVFERVSLTGNIQGAGLTLETADFSLQAAFNYIDLFDYRYRNLQSDAVFSKERINGKISVQDKNLVAGIDGIINLEKNNEFFRFGLQVDTANLQALRLLPIPLSVSTRLDADVQGLNLDSLYGELNILQADLKMDDRQLQLGEVNMQSLKGEGERKFQLESNLINFFTEGNYNIKTLYSDIGRLVKEYRLIFLNNQEQLAGYYNQKNVNRKALEKYKLNYRINLWHINPVLKFFNPHLSLSDSVQLTGSFTGGYTSIFSVNGKADQIAYKDYRFKDNSIDITSSKIRDSTNVLASGFINSAVQQYGYGEGMVQTENFFLEAIWDNTHIDFYQEVFQQSTGNLAELSGELNFLTDTTVLAFSPSNFRALQKYWQLNRKNRVTFTRGKMIVDSLEIYRVDTAATNQSLLVNGTLSKKRDEQLNLSVVNFNLDNVSPLTQKNYSGILNGSVSLNQYYPKGADSVFNEWAGKFNLQNFRLEQFEVGSLTGDIRWEGGKKAYFTSAQLLKKDSSLVDVKGYVNPYHPEAQLNLEASIQGLNINFLEPYVSDFFTNLGGLVNAELNIGGRITAPQLNGNGNLAGGTIKINYLNTMYSLSGNLVFDPNRIGSDGLTVTDSRGETGILKGGVFHDEFRDFVVDAYAEVDNFTLLNTNLADNELYYGTGYGTGDLSIFGAFANMNITANLRTEKGTRLYVPLEGTEQAVKSDFISFVEDTVNQVDEELTLNPSGVQVDLNIEATPDAYCELIFDVRTGDIIRGRGKGDLRFSINTQGEFSMFGNYELVEGGYNFTLRNIINKEFTIIPGSLISWYGDPYQAVISIDARYSQLATLEPLSLNTITTTQSNETANEENEQVINSPELERPYPAEVVLHLDGKLLNPDLDFEILFSNYPQNNTDVQFVINNFKNTIATDQQELNKQVFSLIVLKRFSPPNSFEGQNVVGGSVSELISNQFSYWVNQVDENLEIDVDLNSLNEESLNTLQLRLSYTFLDGRMRITRDGGFTNVNNEANTQSIIGDVSLEYLITEDGKLRVKLYNRNNFNAINNVDRSTNAALTQGVSLVYTEDFDNFEELMAEISRIVRGNKEEEEPEGEDKEQAPPVTKNNKEPARK